MEGSARDVYNCTNSVDNTYGGGIYGTCVSENTATSTNSNTHNSITTATGTETNTSTDVLASFIANPIVTVGLILILLIFIVWLGKVLVFLIARKRSKRNETS